MSDLEKDPTRICIEAPLQFHDAEVQSRLIKLPNIEVFDRPDGAIGLTAETISRLGAITSPGEVVWILPSTSIGERTLNSTEDETISSLPIIPGRIELDLEGHRLLVDGVEPEDALTKSEFEILKILVASPGRLIPKIELLKIIEEYTWAENSHSVYTHIFRIRRKLKATGIDGISTLIHTVRNAGFRFDPLDEDDLGITPNQLTERDESKFIVIHPGKLELNTEARQLIRDGVAEDITNTDFKLIKYLAERPGKIISRKELISSIWSPEHAELDAVGSLNVYIHRLRKLLGDNDKKMIALVRGYGYRFNPTLES